MFLSRVWLVLTIATIIMLRNECSSSFCQGQQFKNGHTSYEHYEKMMKIDTGYADNMKPKVLEQEAIDNPEKLWHAVHELNHQLLCCYTFDMLHYMYLLGKLFSEEKDLAELIRREDHQVVFLIENCVDMINVLYHFDMLDDMGPLWLVNMFVKYLKSIDKHQLIPRQRNIMEDHLDIFQRLIDMHDKQMCQPQNRYNVQFGGSDLSERLKALDLNPQDKIVVSIETLKQSIHYRYIRDMFLFMRINVACRVYFAGRHLRLESVWKEEGIVRHLFVDFAEITEWENIYVQIKNLYERRQFYSLKDFIENMSKSHSMFMNLLKYILFNNLWTHMTLINLSLPVVSDSEEQSHKLLRPWPDHDTAVGQISVLNDQMASAVKQIMCRFELKDDLELAFIKYAMETPANPMTDVHTNKKMKEWLSKNMDEIHSRVFGCDTKIVRSTGLVSTEYIENRMKILKKISGHYRIKTDSFIKNKIMPNRLFVSVISNYVFFCFMVNFFVGDKSVDIDFGVIRSFIIFSDEFLGISKNVASYLENAV